MIQEHAKLLAYVIDRDGRLDVDVARRVFANGLTEEYFWDYDLKANKFAPNAASRLYGFAKAYYETYDAPPTMDAVVSELMHRSELDAFAKEHINDGLLSIAQFPPLESELGYNLDRVLEMHASDMALSIMQRGSEALKSDPLAAVEFMVKGLSDVLGYRQVDESAIDRTLTLAEMATYLAQELDSKGAVMAGTVPYPYPEANALLGGMAPGELVVFAGPAGSGKSFLGHDLAYHTALVNRMPTVCADREMLHPQNGLRFISRQTQIPSRKLRNRRYRSVAEEELLQAALQEYTEIVRVDDPLLFIPPKLCANTLMIRREVEKHWGGRAPKLVVADYLTEFEPTVKREGWEAVQQITHDLKQLALHFGCPVVTMAQINKRGEVQYATIKHICDTLVILEPDDAQPYVPPQMDEYVGSPGIVHCVVDKARNEASGVQFSLEVEFATASIQAAPEYGRTPMGRDASRHVH